MSPAERHPELAERIAAGARDIAARTVELDYERDSSLAARFGAEGREKCEQDARHHLDYLGEALRTGAPLLFHDYVAWLVQLMGGLGIERAHVRDQLAHLARATQELVEDSGPAVDLLRDASSGIDTVAVPASHILPGSPHEDLARRYLQALVDTRRMDASRMVTEAVEGGLDVRDLYRNVLAPVQREAGRLWQLNRITVAQEHYCTAATQFVMSLLYPRVFAESREGGRTLVASCVSGDLHEIGVRMIADLFQLEGWTTVYLGASTPPRDLVAAVEREGARLLAISATMAPHVRDVARAIEALRANPETRSVPVIVGGRPFDVCPDLAAVVGADGYAADADAAITLANELVA